MHQKANKRRKKKSTKSKLILKIKNKLISIDIKLVIHPRHMNNLCIDDSRLSVVVIVVGHRSLEKIIEPVIS
jgi:hypothetical protein